MTVNMKKVASNDIRARPRVANDRVTVGETSDFYSNNDIITSPDQRATQRTQFQSTKLDINQTPLSPPKQEIKQTEPEN